MHRVTFLKVLENLTLRKRASKEGRSGKPEYGSLGEKKSFGGVERKVPENRFKIYRQNYWASNLKSLVDIGAF